jgi:hypothetical protein
MPRYADSLLAEGEVIVMRTRRHWVGVARDCLYPLVILLAALVLLFLSRGLASDGFGGTLRGLLGWLALAGVVVALLWIGWVAWGWSAEDYIVTNRRVLKVDGILNKHSADSSLEKVNDAVLDQNILGRMLDFGDLDVLTANEQSVDRYKTLNHAPGFKREMLNQKNNLEMDMRHVTTPPLRAGPPAGVPGPAGDSAAAPPSPPRPAMSADEVTSTLTRLADLRDRGALTAEEYEAKKAELLGRL